jgi:hypothetical protein
VILLSLNAVIQAANEPPILGVAIVLAIVLSEIIKQMIGPILAKSKPDDTPTMLLRRITNLLERVVDETGALLVLARANHDWHEIKDAEGRPLAYYPREEVMRILTGLEERLRRIEHSRGSTSGERD